MFDIWIDIIFMGAHTQCKINLCTVGNTAQKCLMTGNHTQNSLETTDLGGVANPTYVGDVGMHRPGGRLQSP